MGQIKTSTLLSWVCGSYFPHASSEEKRMEETVGSQVPRSGAAHTHLGQHAAPEWFLAAKPL